MAVEVVDEDLADAAAVQVLGTAEVTKTKLQASNIVPSPSLSFAPT